MELKKFIGILKFDKTHIVILPNIYITVRKKDVFKQYHYWTFEIKFLFFGIGIKYEWENKNVQPIPPVNELF